jgi:hypothetical protein
MCANEIRTADYGLRTAKLRGAGRVVKSPPYYRRGLAPNRYTGALVLDCALQQIIIESI